jgi:hypothetical protein
MRHFGYITVFRIFCGWKRKQSWLPETEVFRLKLGWMWESSLLEFLLLQVVAFVDVGMPQYGAAWVAWNSLYRWVE